jgi:hypothetical protein
MPSTDMMAVVVVMWVTVTLLLIKGIVNGSRKDFFTM